MGSQRIPRMKTNGGSRKERATSDTSARGRCCRCLDSFRFVLFVGPVSIGGMGARFSRGFVCAVVALGFFALASAQAADQPRDYTSRVPKFTFAQNAAAQEAQLRENPLMLRFRE